MGVVLFARNLGKPHPNNDLAVVFVAVAAIGLALTSGMQSFRKKYLRIDKAGKMAAGRIAAAGDSTASPSDDPRSRDGRDDLSAH